MTDAAHPSPEVLHRPESSRYEILVDGSLAGWVLYEVRDGVTVLVHTEVLPGNEGRGLAGVLVGGAIADIVARGGRFAATCEYVQHWLTTHHAFDDALVPPPAL